MATPKQAPTAQDAPREPILAPAFHGVEALNDQAEALLADALDELLEATCPASS